MTPSSVEFSEGLDYTEVVTLLRALGRIPKEFQREMRPRLRAAGQNAFQQAMWNATYSSRIPHSLTLQVSFAARRPGVSIRASLAVAPHARVMEGLLTSTFRHPVFGRAQKWVLQDSRPYLLPAVEAGGSDVRDAAVDIVNEVHRRLGLA